METNMMLSSGKHSSSTQRAITIQTLKDRHMIAERMKANQHLYRKVELALALLLNDKCRKTDLLAFARKIIAEKKLKIERLMKRSRPVLICWFCEHLDDVPLLAKLINLLGQVDKYGYERIFSNDDSDKNIQTTAKSDIVKVLSEDNEEDINLSVSDEDSVFSFSLEEEEILFS